ncbi:hypothetical protein [Jejuia pallidilutea]|uniref:Uncharacterized protein n=1 Tax=Jejuia pallidilutea TaxID=504487 RepID=A0A090VWY4_9FLAO|nr:hypothetical protein [Jejuia pallidilutea]GAL67779.1 hypothetical protein JCM19301_1066 [Jejuia pallidilutea]GAL88277.1 hypothetical protein JCM19538_1603 [Jejuia pallidilutea]
MLFHYVSKNQIDALLKLRKVQSLNEHLKTKRAVKAKEKKTKRINPSAKVCHIEKECSDTIKSNIKQKVKDKIRLLPKDKVRFPKKSSLKKPSKSYGVYAQIAKYGMGKLIYINSK